MSDQGAQQQDMHPTATPPTDRTHAADRKASAPTAPAPAKLGDLAEKTNHDLEPEKPRAQMHQRPWHNPPTLDTQHWGQKGAGKKGRTWQAGEGERENGARLVTRPA